MNRERLDRMSTDQLREEADKYHLPSSGNRGSIIDVIMSHWERHGPAPDWLGGDEQQEDGMHRNVSPVAAAQADEEPVTASRLRQVLQAVTADMMLRQKEMQQQQLQFMQQQQQQFSQLAEMLTARREVPTAEQYARSTAVAEQNGPAGERRGSTSSRTQIESTSPIMRAPYGCQPGNTVKWLASQVPEFGGSDEENVQAWVNRIDKVAQVHGATDAVVLLAASSRLSKSARKWYEIQTGEVLESWISLRREIIKIFDRKVPFYKAIQKVEARRWNTQKETFDRYAIDKMALMQRLELPVPDSIQLLIGGINQSSLRITALSIKAVTMESFLDQMRHITEGLSEAEKRSSSGFGKPTRPKEDACRNCGKKGHFHTECRDDPICFYCKAPGHRKYDCPNRKKKDAKEGQPTKFPLKATVASVDTVTSTPDAVAAVEEAGSRIEINNPMVTISEIAEKKCKLLALMDTGSPVSFIRYSIYEKYLKPNRIDLIASNRELRNLSNESLKVIGMVKVKLALLPLRNMRFEIDLFVLNDNTCNVDLILGREFLNKERLTLVYRPTDKDDGQTASLFSCLPLCFVEENTAEGNLENKIENVLVDFGEVNKKRLKEILLEIQKKDILPVEDDYSVQVRLKDQSIYAYAPRKFAYVERQQIREIIDDLLNRDIIQPSVSSYCARVVPVKKKTGQIRLCIDLRPLNSRVQKQKFPFPVIEECLSRLGNKSVFTLLDLKDSFHQIKVHKDSRKYFSFATPDGQYEFKRLPFGFSEAPAEFQKRLIQILNPLIRENKVLVYIDDILIATETVESNLSVLKEVLTILKSYEFDLNIDKCLFLRNKIEYLGYIVSGDGLTLSTRHTEAILEFKKPKNLIELQRFLGLANYFRKFVKDYALKAKPLQNLLKKQVKFLFDEECENAFQNLKKELTTYPVLRLYNPYAETELHTDACTQGLGAILLQKQKDNLWSPVAYYSRTTNEAERKYHSFELEMLAMVKSIERFHLYLYGISFTIVTDCNALVYAVNKANLNPRIARWTLALQNYTFKVTHRPGSRMLHVDALSRSVGYVNELPLERELEFRQLADPRIKEISNSLEYNDSDKFALVNGLVYKKDNENLKFVVPESMVINILRAHHDDMAHCALEKTLRGISQQYWFPTMRKRIADYLENCFTCVMANSSMNRFEGETHVFPQANTPMDIIHVDHFGPLQETESKFKHILVMVDAFTRFTWLFAVKSTSSKETMNCLSVIFDLFGKPKEIVSDRGTAFTAKEFSDFVEKLNIKHRKVAVAAPWANGLVERVNRFLKSSLIKITNKPDEWKKHLGTVQYIINNTFHTAIKASPSKVMLGYQQRNHEDFPLAQFVNELAKIDQSLELDREKSRDIAFQATEMLRQYNKMYRDAKSKTPTVYEEGDYVAIRNTRVKPGVNAKLRANYKGPYLIQKSIGANRYVVTDIPGHNVNARPLNTVISSDRLRYWIKPVKPQ